MNEERERADSVGPYGKSLLYLVSRALERVHKTPLLGMEAAWSPNAEETDIWNPSTYADLKTWRDFATGGNSRDDKVRLIVHPEKTVSDGRQDIPLAHGSFDNDVAVIRETLKQIRGAKLCNDVESLRGF